MLHTGMAGAFFFLSSRTDFVWVLRVNGGIGVCARLHRGAFACGHASMGTGFLGCRSSIGGGLMAGPGVLVTTPAFWQIRMGTPCRDEGC